MGPPPLPLPSPLLITGSPTTIHNINKRLKPCTELASAQKVPHTITKMNDDINVLYRCYEFGKQNKK